MYHRTQKVLEAFLVHGGWRASGDVLELGVGKGTTTAYLAEAVSRAGSNKKYYACDTFCGLPHTEGNLKKGSIKYGMKTVLQTLSDHPYGDFTKRVTLVEGMIENTLPEIADSEFCFAWVDMDLAKPTKYAIKWLEDRMTKGGIIGFHDYGFHGTPGIKPAVDSTLNWSKYQRMNIEAINTIFVQKK